jgi:SNF2 family DNA or RNA helicase
MTRIEQDFIYIMTNYGDKEKLKNLNGVWFKDKGWRFPKNLWAMSELEYYITSLKSDVQFQREKENLQRDFYSLIERKKQTYTYNHMLRPYQNQDVHYLLNLDSAGVFNEPRTGKTPTTIELIRQLNKKKNLVICPASLIWNWEKEFKQWYPDHPVTVIHESKAKRLIRYKEFEKGTMIISKDTWKSDHTMVNIRFDVCIVDEAHFLRNYKTAQSESVCKVQADRRYALTGTPSVKHAVDIYGILKFLQPKKYPSYWQFVDRYFHKYETFYGTDIGSVKGSRSVELQEMTGLLSVQRKRSDIMQWLPSKTRVDFPVVMNDKQAKLYKQMAEEFCAQDDEVVVDTSTVLTQLLRLRQLTIDPRLLGFDVVGEKTKAIIEYLQNSNEPIVLMSMFTSYLKLLEKELKDLGFKVGMINGEMNHVDKQQTVTSFQRGELDVVLCNIISAGVGFTLDKAETIIFVDKAWNPSDNEQAEDRITPVSQERNHKHMIITFECVRSVDHKINKLLNQKKRITDIINEGGLQAIKRLIKEED